MAMVEDFMLLALREQDARPVIGNLQFECGLAAAVLLDLADAGRVDLGGERVVVLDPTPLGMPPEDAALARLAAEQPNDLVWWVRALRVGLYGQILARLVARGVLTERRGRFLLVFPAVRHTMVDGGSVRELRTRVQASIHDRSADRSSVALLAISHATGLDRALFPAVDPAVIQARIDQLGADGLARAVTKVIKSVLVAVMAATTVG